MKTTRRLYGTPGQNTAKPPESQHPETFIAEDGFRMHKRDQMYRMIETMPGRREAEYPHFNNLGLNVLERAVRPPVPIEGEIHKRREKLWEDVAQATKEALATLPPGTHVAVTANSGPYSEKLEVHPPGKSIPGAAVGLLYVAEFRTEDQEIHEDWIQIAVPVRPDEGRLFAGIRLVPTVLDSQQLTFTVFNLTNMSVPLDFRNYIRNHPDLPYGSISNSWVPVNLGCYFHRGGLFREEYDVVKASFAWDGDLYSWDEAIIFTRNPIAVITYSKPGRRFEKLADDTVFEGVNWFHVVDGQLRGGYQKETRRVDVIAWDKDGIPQGQIRAYTGV
ncbi:hypothetical protein F5Y18DRAFT_386694 [Xylariaceae sp. FL1019]|nr:hypothetical protein F5Y18DRAFT_386694 [Xylariaceae sp. FL1019]